jgi:prepilin-type N-terminal cleavage/methylation domain-containing protein
MKKTARFLVEKGFTLVELLIVIALIGVLAVAVLAAINPLEQLNRARDTGMESDASQLLAAIDRYYASQEKFPWVTLDPVNVKNEDALDMVSAADPTIGVCGALSCTDSTGLLLAQYELKSEFQNRKFILATEDIDKLWMGKAEGASSSVYACWVPTSMAKRAQAIRHTDIIPDPVAAPCVATGWGALDTACFICIPR